MISSSLFLLLVSRTSLDELETVALALASIAEAEQLSIQHHTWYANYSTAVVHLMLYVNTGVERFFSRIDFTAN